jgi:hypothetical protein
MCVADAEKRPKYSSLVFFATLRLCEKNKNNLSQRRKAAKGDTSDFGCGYAALRSPRLCVNLAFAVYAACAGPQHNGN